MRLQVRSKRWMIEIPAMNAFIQVISILVWLIAVALFVLALLQQLPAPGTFYATASAAAALIAIYLQNAARGIRGK